MSPVRRCESCGKRPEHCECPDADEDDKDFVAPAIQQPPGLLCNP